MQVRDFLVFSFFLMIILKNKKHKSLMNKISKNIIYYLINVLYNAIKI